VGIIVAVIILCILVFFFVMYRRFRVKRSREGANPINNETRKDIMLNSARPNDNEFKRGSKLSNLEVSQVWFCHNFTSVCYVLDKIRTVFIKSCDFGLYK